MTEIVQEKFDCWALMELFGHTRFAGRVVEQQIGGSSFIRLDVPEVVVVSSKGTDTYPPFTKFFGPGAIYSITPVEESVARKLVASLRAEAIQTWNFPNLRQLSDGEPDVEDVLDDVLA